MMSIYADRETLTEGYLYNSSNVLDQGKCVLDLMTRSITHSSKNGVSYEKAHILPSVLANYGIPDEIIISTDDKTSIVTYSGYSAKTSKIYSLDKENGKVGYGMVLSTIRYSAYIAVLDSGIYVFTNYGHRLISTELRLSDIDSSLRSQLANSYSYSLVNEELIITKKPNAPLWLPDKLMVN